MKRRILIPIVEDYPHCVVCDFQFNDSTGVQFRTEDGKALCIGCALSCDWCGERYRHDHLIVMDGAHRQFVCRACTGASE